MRLGFELPVGGAWAWPPNQQQVAARAVELGYASLWCFQRLLVLAEPGDDDSPLPGRPWPPLFRSTVDPTVGLVHVVATTHEAVGVPFHHRGARLDDFVDWLRAIWASDMGEHHGSCYSIPAGRVDPPPVQKPHDQGDQRGPLQGAREQILADIATYEQATVSELVVDCNVDASVGGSDSDVDAAIERDWTVREAFEPQHLGRW